MWRSSRNTEHCDYTYVAAVDKLRTMLQKHDPGEPKVVQFGASVSQCSCQDYNFAELYQRQSMGVDPYNLH